MSAPIFISDEHIAGNDSGTQALTVPTSATIAHILAEGGDCRYGYSGTINVSTASTGTLLADGKERYLFDRLSAVLLDIPTGTTLHVNYFRQ